VNISGPPPGGPLFFIGIITNMSKLSLIVRTSTLSLLLLISACKAASPTPPLTNPVKPSLPAALTPGITLTATLTAAPALPTLTPEPLAANINGQAISLAEYQAEMERYKAALQAAGRDLPAEADQKQTVLDELISQMLLAQAASQDGYRENPDDFNARLAQLSANAGGADAFAAWQQQHAYDNETFQAALHRSIAAAWERDHIISQVPQTADQVHARQIIVYNKETAQAILSKLKAGVDFATMALQYDPVTRGELGWFPRGYLTIPEVEQAAFSLDVNAYSDIIQSKVGFHIVQVLERDPQRPLSPDARLVYERKALQSWLEERRSKSQINILIS